MSQQLPHLKGGKPPSPVSIRGKAFQHFTGHGLVPRRPLGSDIFWYLERQDHESMLAAKTAISNAECGVPLSKISGDGPAASATLRA